MYSPVYLLATPSFTGKDFADLVAQAKAKPGALPAVPEVAERLTRLDNVVAPSSAEQFGQVIRREYEANAKVVAKAGIRSE
jgi:tripartite-type tricarboxylate transporter receptor subunit TctC